LVHDETTNTTINDKKPPAAINGHQLTEATLNDHADGVFLNLHPQIRGSNTIKCISKVDYTLGVNENSIHHWVSLSDKSFEKFIHIWYSLVYNLTLKFVNTHFTVDWASQLDISDDLSVSDQMVLYHSKGIKTQTKIISNMMTATPKVKYLSQRRMRV